MTYRISPSQINVFLNEPAIWVLNKFFGVYGDMGAAAKRGNAIELGLTSVLMNNMDFDTSLKRSLEVFDQEMSKIEDEGTAEERDLIEPMLKQAVELFLNIDPPKQAQIRMEPTILELPILAIADFDMGEYMTDLKTTKRCPSSPEGISAEHIRQITIYKMASGKKQKLAYVTDKKHALYEVSEEQHATSEKEIKAAAKAMRAAFDIEEKQGKETLSILYPPRDTKGFWWDKKTLQAAQSIWF